jgi:hypothetical protein
VETPARTETRARGPFIGRASPSRSPRRSRSGPRVRYGTGIDLDAEDDAASEETAGWWAWCETTAATLAPASPAADPAARACPARACWVPARVADLLGPSPWSEGRARAGLRDRAARPGSEHRSTALNAFLALALQEDVRTTSPSPEAGDDRQKLLTARQIALVQASWLRMAPIAELAAAVFQSPAVERDPRLARLFPHDTTDQGRKLMALLREVVARLDRLGDVVPAVETVGHRHHAYGVQDGPYDTIGEGPAGHVARRVGCGPRSGSRGSLGRVPHARRRDAAARHRTLFALIEHLPSKQRLAADHRGEPKEGIMNAGIFVANVTHESKRKARRGRLASRLGAAMLAVALSAQGALADMSVGRNSAAVDDAGTIQGGAITTLATVTITKLRRHTIVLVDATVTKIDPNLFVEIYLSTDGVLSGPIGYCQSTTTECAVSFHRPFDADERTIGAPMTFSLLAYTPGQQDGYVQYGFTAHVVKK